MELVTRWLEDPHSYKTTGVAARVGDLVGLQVMVWNGRPVDVFDNRGWSPLHEAAAKGFSGCLEFLLRQQDVDPDWTTHRHESALVLAARSGHFQCLRALINAKANINLMTNEGISPLFEAITARSNDCIRLLVKKGAVVNHVVYTGYTPLHQAASTGNTGVTSYLLQQGAEQNVRCHEGLTPLFLAVQSGNIDTVRVLLNRLPDAEDAEDDVVNIAAEDNATPLLIAAQEGHEEIIELLLQHGADPNIQVTDTRAGPLQYAVYCNRMKCVRKLLPVTDLLMFDNDFSLMHPLVLALSKHTPHMLNQLLTAGISPTGARLLDSEQSEEFRLNLYDLMAEKEWSASLLCHVPAEANLVASNLDTVRCLLDTGFSPNVQGEGDLHELPPLVAAMSRQNLPLVQLLLEYGAKPNVYYLTHNMTMLCALFFDMQNSAVLDFLIREEEIDESGDAALTNCRYTWMEQGKRSFLIHLFAAGGELESLLRSGLESGWRLHSVLQHILRYQRSPNPGQLERRQTCVTAVLALCLCLSYNVETFPSELQSCVSVDQAKELNSLAEKSGTLAQLCRRHVFRQLCVRSEGMEGAVKSLGLPDQVADYLLFPELEPYSLALSRAVMPARSQ